MSWWYTSLINELNPCIDRYLFIWSRYRTHSGCVRSTGDAYSSYAPEPSSCLFRGPCLPYLNYVFLIGVLRFDHCSLPPSFHSNLNDIEFPNFLINMHVMIISMGHLNFTFLWNILWIWYLSKLNLLHVHVVASGIVYRTIRIKVRVLDN